MTVTAQNNDTQSQWISRLLHAWYASTTNIPTLQLWQTLEIIWKRSSPHELYHYLSHTVGLKARLCTLLFPPKLLTKQSPPIEAETKEESGDSQKMKPSKKRLTVWKGSTKRRCKSQGARKNQETWGEPGQEGAREAQREKKKGSWIYNYMKKSEMHFEDFV